MITSKWKFVWIRQSTAAPVLSKYRWPEGTSINGSQASAYRLKAFVEVHTTTPGIETFFRCNAETIEVAESTAVMLYGKYEDCLANGTHDEYERRDYTNGVGFCKTCGMFKSHAFEPTTLCVVCGKPSTDGVRNRILCDVHKETDPEYQEHWRKLRADIAEMEKITPEEFEQSLREVFSRILSNTPKEQK